jgi:hypothetical protein
VLLQPITATRPFPYPVTERHNHVREPAFRLLMVWIRRPADILRLVAVPAGHIPLDPLLLFPLPRLEGFVLRIDLVEPPGAFTWCVIKLAAKETIIETAA